MSSSIYKEGLKTFTKTKESPRLTKTLAGGFTLVMGRAPSKSTGKVPIHNFDDIAAGIMDKVAGEAGKEYYWELQPFTRLDAVRVELLSNLEGYCPPGTLIWCNSASHEVKSLVEVIRPAAEVIIE